VEHCKIYITIVLNANGKYIKQADKATENNQCRTFAGDAGTLCRHKTDGAIVQYSTVKSH